MWGQFICSLDSELFCPTLCLNQQYFTHTLTVPLMHHLFSRRSRTDIWFCLLLISLEGQTKSFPSISPVSLNTIWWSHTTVTELKKKQLFFFFFLFPRVISHLIYSLHQHSIVYWRKEFLNCFDKGNLPGLGMYQVCFMWAHTHTRLISDQTMLCIWKLDSNKLNVC